ncbi:MAG: hypothetical protein AAF438_20975, partial [Pseudomonadota bacterium]
MYHQLVMHNWSEVQSQISINDVQGAVHYQMNILRELEVTRRRHGNGADTLSSSILHRGQFGFLSGLGIDWKQTWIFAVCLYVTVMAFIVHCCPVLNAFPNAPNVPNLSARLRRQFSDRAQGPQEPGNTPEDHARQAATLCRQNVGMFRRVSQTL